MLRPEHLDLLDDVFAKGVSSRRLRQRFEIRTHRDRHWSRSYFAASAGGAPLSTIRQYIEAQRRPL